jgi:hypothetical protein
MDKQDTRPLWAATGSGEVFRERARYNPNEEEDVWIEYENVRTNEIYTCRLEAFASRFRSLPNGR